MTLGTIQPLPQEHANLLGHHVLGKQHFAASTEVVPRGTVVALGRDAFSRYLVVRLVLSDTVAEPFPIKLGRLGIPLRVRVHSQEIAEAKRPIVHIFGGVDQDLNQLVPLLGILACQKLPHAIGRRQRAHHVQADPAQELPIIRRLGGENAELP